MIFPIEIFLHIASFCTPIAAYKLSICNRKFLPFLDEKRQEYYGHFTQAKTMFHVKNKENVFLHGPGGCGKSFTIEMIYNHFKKEEKNIKFCSMFGRAASNLKEGYTICSLVSTAKINRDNWFNPNTDKGRKRIARSSKVFRDLDVLVIDEISTCGRRTLENMDMLAQYAKRNNLPMGGIQLIIVGDFYQLEPIGDTCCWKSPLFNQYNFHKIDYEYSFRQKEKIFSLLLQRVRKGKHNEHDINILKSRLTNNIPDNVFYIFGDNKRANDMNIKNLDLLPYPLLRIPFTFEYEDRARPTNDLGTFKAYTEAELEQMVQKSYAHIHPKILLIKEDARVLLCKNICVPKGYCNGAQGRFHIRNGEFYFIPDKKYISPEGVVEEELRIEFMSFYIPITPRYFAIRHGLPIKLGYSGTVHAVQGITLNEIAVCLDKTINRKGQAYTAISRVSNLESLYFSHFDENYFRYYHDLTY